MNPVKFNEANIVYAPPALWDSEALGPCGELNVCVDQDGTHVSVWEPTAEERAKIANGANIQLGVVTNQQPPVYVALYGDYPILAATTAGGQPPRPPGHNPCG